MKNLLVKVRGDRESKVSSHFVLLQGRQQARQKK